MADSCSLRIVGPEELRDAMSEEPLRGIGACVFDAYGTLFDFTSTVTNFRVLPAEKLQLLNTIWREKQLQYTWLRTLEGQHADFWQVIGDALDYAMEEVGVAGSELRVRLMNLYLALDTFPEVPEMLGGLKAAGIKTAILSNGSPRMLAKAVEHAKIGHLLDEVLSVEEVGVFKTHPKVYQLACNRLGVGKGAIAFMSSNAWDVWAASAFGMRTVWCNRNGNLLERLPGKPDREVKTLEGLAKLVERK
jgi:2-haloacid dehalogenase